MSLVLERAKAWEEALNAAGLRAVIDPRNMNPPCTVIAPPAIDYPSLGSIRLTWTLHVVAPPPGNLDAWAKLDEMLEKLRELIPLVTARPRSSFTMGDGTPLPTYEVSFVEFVTNA